MVNKEIMKEEMKNENIKNIVNFAVIQWVSIHLKKIKSYVIIVGNIIIKMMQ